MPIDYKSIADSLTFRFPYDTDQWKKDLKYENYHCHKDFTNVRIPDSPVTIDDYAKRIKELGTVGLYSGEHGTQGNHFQVYECAEKNGLKYIHSSEAYWVKDRHEKDGTNCHIYIAATCAEGREDLNYILSIANEDGFYSQPRIDLELLFSVKPENFIVTSACMAGWKYEDADEIWLKIADYFGENFFLEVQAHNTEPQKQLNRHILDLAERHGLQIIAGVDSHYITADQDKKRNVVLAYKKIHYDDEDGWYLDYPDGQTEWNRFVEQGVLSEEQICRAMMNTNVFAAKCQQIILDRNFKIPCVYPNTTYDDRVEIFKQIIKDAYSKERLQTAEKWEGVEYETSHIVESGVVDYFLMNYRGLKEAIENYGGVLTTTSRGSMASFIVNRLLGFTTVDRFNSEIPIYPERFLTKDRVLAGSFPDCDYNLADQEPFVKAFRHIIGEHSVYPLMAVGKIKEKAAWQMYASVSGINPQTANEVSRYIDAYNEELKNADEDDKDSINIEDFIPKEYMSVYMESQEWQNITINLKVHACGHIVLEGDVRRKIGLISALSKTTGKRTLCACVEGSYLDSFGMVKNDFLIVQVVALIKECWDSIGESVPTFEELRELVADDAPTWDIYKIGATCCVNQLERFATAEKAKVYQPQNIAELSAFIAGIRPGFKSLIGNFLARKPYTTGEPKIDELLEDSYHYLLYQESIMKLLSFLGLPMPDCYGVIKAISKKKLKGEKLEHLKEQLTSGWMSKIGNMDNFDKVWQVINDAARYSFNSPHSLSMAGDSLYLAWFKAHHTAKFYETAINHYQTSGEKAKVEALLTEAKTFYGYKMGNYKFGDDNRRVIVNEQEHIIYPSLAPIKSISSNAADILYAARDKARQFTKRGQLYEWLASSGINSTTRNILFEIGYFSAFGKINQLKAEYDIYEKYADCKVLSKSKLSEELIPKIAACCEKETDKSFRGIDTKKLINTLIMGTDIPPTTTIDAIRYSLLRLGYCTIRDSSYPLDQCVVADVDISPYGTVKCSLYSVNLGYMRTIKMNGKFWPTHKVSAGDLIEILVDEKPTWKKNADGEFVKDGGKEKYVKCWSKKL